MIERYGGLEEENVYLVPANVNLDCAHNYPKSQAPRNARTSRKTVRLSNGVHPSADGYRQIGDSIYCWLKARLAETGDDARRQGPARDGQLQGSPSGQPQSRPRAAGRGSAADAGQAR
jgi:hypothetical protein